MATIRRAIVAVVFSTFAPSRTKSSTISGGSAVIAMETMTRKSCGSGSSPPESERQLTSGGGGLTVSPYLPDGRTGLEPVIPPPDTLAQAPRLGLFIGPTRPTRPRPRPDLTGARNKPDPDPLTRPGNSWYFDQVNNPHRRKYDDQIYEILLYR